MNERRLENLRRLLNPRSVAMVGGRTLAPAIETLRRIGYGGRVHVVNPQQAEIGGIRCVPGVADLPEVPDAAFLSVNRHLTVQAIEAMGPLGVAGAVCFAAGFGEMGEEGRALERRMVAAAGDMALVGPNSNGLVNRLDRLALWPTSGHSLEPLDAGVAFIAQSGGVASMLLRDRRGLAPAIVVSTGNQTLLDPADWLAVLAPDPRVRAVGLFMESPGNVAELSLAAQLAASHRKPVVALKSGRTELGMQMAATHTGAMAGDDELFDALCERLGFIRVRSLPQMTETMKALGAWGGLRGRRLVVATASGAARTLFADAATDLGLVFPPPSPRMAAELRPQLPEFAHVSNPLDYNAAYTGQVGLTLENEPALFECFRTVLSDGFDLALLHTEGTEIGPQGTPALRAWIAACRASSTPGGLASLMPENMSSQAQQICREQGLACLQGLDEAMFAVAAVARFGEQLAAGAARPGQEAPLPLPPSGCGRRRVWNEWDSKQRLAASGLVFPKRQFCDAEAVSGAAGRVGYPVVLKAVSAALPHKHRVGAVALGLGSAQAVQAALARMVQSLGRAGVDADGFMVEEMLQDGVAELIVGIKSSPIYGHALLIGAGGVLAEQLRDSVALLLPASEPAIRRALGRLKIAQGLDDAALQGVAALARAVAGHAMAHRGELAALDLNPVIVTATGRVMAVDALVETWEPAP
jgi:acyl-CoA synthetase (NDP forming)